MNVCELGMGSKLLEAGRQNEPQTEVSLPSAHGPVPCDLLEVETALSCDLNPYHI